MRKLLASLIIVSSLIVPLVSADHTEDGEYGGNAPAYYVTEETVLRSLPEHVFLPASPDGLPHISARARISHDDNGLQPGIYLCIYPTADGTGDPIDCRGGCFESPWIDQPFVSAKAWVYVLNAGVATLEPNLSACGGASSGLALIESITDPWA